jgi:hypothetical protein
MSVSSLTCPESIEEWSCSACFIAGIWLARNRQVNVRLVPTGKAIEESVDLDYEIFNRVFRGVPEKLKEG